MKTLYLQCAMGAAGDMLMAALWELLDDKDEFIRTMNGLQLPGVTVRAEPSVRCGIRGTHMAVAVRGEEEHSHDGGAHPHAHPHRHVHLPWQKHPHTHDHVHRGITDIETLLQGLPLPEKVRADALAVYRRIAQAESSVHGVPVEQIHFHEVGSLDALADVVGVCLAMYRIAPEKIVCSPVNVGSGQVRCAHGLLPVPAPATALLLTGVPVYSGEISGELCTPTGAALLTHFAQEYGDMPMMKTEKIGYGMGTKEFPAANCVRALLGETADGRDSILEFCCNLDDMTPEAIGFAVERLFAAGALDVYTTPIGMKKNRPGILLSCMCREEKREEMVRLLFLHSTTLGIREYRCGRYTLSRSMRTEETAYGSVRVKRASGWGTVREKPEFEDVAKIARENNMSLRQVQALLGE